MHLQRTLASYQRASLFNLCGASAFIDWDCSANHLRKFSILTSIFLSKSIILERKVE